MFFFRVLATVRLGLLGLFVFAVPRYSRRPTPSSDAQVYSHRAEEHDKQLQPKQIISIHRLSCAQFRPGPVATVCARRNTRARILRLAGWQTGSPTPTQSPTPDVGTLHTRAPSIPESSFRLAATGRVSSAYAPQNSPQNGFPLAIRSPRFAESPSPSPSPYVCS